MLFGEIDIDDAAGSWLAHSYKTRDGRIRKGQQLSADLIDQLRDSGIQRICVATLEADDVHEDDAALTLAEKLSGPGTRLGPATTGRVNIHASEDGLCEFSSDEIHAINRIDESITVATLPPSSRVVSGQILATVKIIPYATNRHWLEQAVTRIGYGVTVHPLKAATVCLIHTTLPGQNPTILDKSLAVTRQRLVDRRAQLMQELRTPHTLEALSKTLRDVVASRRHDWILVLGASAISDRRDVVPQAITMNNGHIEHFGMPMDPGNLLLLGSIQSQVVIGMPGCSRSRKHNGLDRVLDKLACGLAVDSDWISSLGVGGLLSEIVDRPRPREVATDKRTVAALLLGAGRSTRVGEAKKLLPPWQGLPLIHHVANTINQSGISSTLVITGHQHALVSRALQQFNDKQTVTAEAHQARSDNMGHLPPRLNWQRNESHANGMASSLVKGVSALIDFDAIVVCLGDMPQVPGQVIDLLIDAFRQHPDKALYIPCFQGRRGNPVLIAKRLFDSVLTLEGDTGARVLARQFPAAVMEVETDCQAVVQDIDTPDQFNTLLQPSPE